MSVNCGHHVAFIDSGIGGFSIMQEVERQLPGIGISYFMDNLYLPYGKLSEQALLSRLEGIVAFLQHAVKPDLIVVACNTASTQALDFLRQRFEQVFVGVVPAVKPAALQSSAKRIGLLATPATVTGLYIDNLIAQFALDCEVKKLGSVELVHIAEGLFWQEPLAQQSVEFSEFTGVDTVVLGCTHFPLIKDFIAAHLPSHVRLIDSGAAIANRVSDLLGKRYEPSSVKNLYASGELSQLRRQRLSQMGFDSISIVAC